MKTSDEMKQATEALSRLFSSFKQSLMDDVDERLRAYLHAVKEYEMADVLSAIDRFIQGEVPTFSGDACPSTAQLCPEIRNRRKAREIRAENAARDAGAIPLRPAGHWLTKYEAERGQSQGSGA